MTEALWVAVIGLLAVPVSLLVGWFVNRKKNISDIYKSITDQSVGAAGMAVEAMQNAMETLHEELVAAQAKIEILIQENQKMQSEISKLRQQNLLLLQENHSLHQKIDDLVSILHDTGELPVISDSESSQNDN